MVNYSATAMRKTLLALFLSFVVTSALGAVYAFYPLIAMWFGHMSGGPETGGVAAVAGGVQSTALLIVWPIVFVVLFLLLHRKRANQ